MAGKVHVCVGVRVEGARPGAAQVGAPIVVDLRMPDIFIRPPDDSSEGACATKAYHRSDSACARTRGRGDAFTLGVEKSRLPLQVEQSFPVTSEWTTIRHGRLHVRNHKRVTVKARTVQGQCQVKCTAWYSPLSKQIYFEVDAALDVHVEASVQRTASTEVGGRSARKGNDGVQTEESFRVKVREVVQLSEPGLTITFDPDVAKPRPRDSFLNVDPDTCQVAQIAAIFALIFSLISASYSIRFLPVLLLAAGLVSLLVGFDRNICQAVRSDS